jgi:hypothetical protein
MVDTSSPCPACGVRSTGAFCAQCGVARDIRFCRSCGTAVTAGARFCATCGTSVAARPDGGPARTGRAPMPATPVPSWIYLGGGTVAVAAILWLVWPKGPAPTSVDQPVAVNNGTAPAAGNPTAIDLSTMTPREQFDRLYNRVMRAAEGGDEATVTQFAPMALGAYAQLLPGDMDADARYHAAMIRMHTDDPAGAAALADTIRAEEPSHLFSFVIQGTLARQRKDAARLLEEQRGFLQHYDAEMAAKRSEYEHHAFILNQFVGEARTATGN